MHMKAPPRREGGGTGKEGRRRKGRKEGRKEGRRKGGGQEGVVLRNICATSTCEVD